MADKPKYYDIRTPLWEKYWQKALSYSKYLDRGGDGHKQKWEAVYNRITVKEEQQKTISSFVRPFNRGITRSL